MSEHVVSLVKGLADAGIEYAFGITGSGASLGLITGLQERGVQYYPVGHEGAAALMAGACCRDGRSRAVAVSIKGPGFINMAPGMLSNWYEGRPALSVSEAYATNTPPARQHKRADHAAIAGTLVKAYDRCDGRREQVTELVTVAQAEYPGPVHLDLGLQPEAQRSQFAVDASTAATPADAVTEVCERIAASRRPAVILGSVARRVLADTDWNSLRVPVVTTASAKGVMNETSDFAGGVITGEITDYAPEAGVLAEADLLVGFGLRNNEVVKATPMGAPMILIDCVGGDAQAGFEAETVLLDRDLVRPAERTVAALREKHWGEDIVAVHRQRWKELLLTDEWLPASVFSRLQSQIDTRPVLVLDTGFFCTVGETVWQAMQADGFCGSSVGRFMGTAIPTAIGVAISTAPQPVVCVVGDGGISPYVGEIKLAVAERLPILFMLFSDGRYGSVAAFSDINPLVERAVNFSAAGWWRVVESLGCAARPVSDFAALSNALSAWEPTAGPFFIECAFEPEPYAAIAKRLR